MSRLRERRIYDLSRPGRITFAITIWDCEESIHLIKGDGSDFYGDVFIPWSALDKVIRHLEDIRNEEGKVV